jgi:hypothetical protein
VDDRFWCAVFALLLFAGPSYLPVFLKSAAVARCLCPDTTTVTAAVSQFTKPGDDWANRLQVNATYYKGNYSIIFFSFLLYSIIANPFLLMSILILTGSWTFLLSGRPRLEDGSLAPLNIGGRVLTGMEQKAGLGVSSRFCLAPLRATGLLHAPERQRGRCIFELELLEDWHGQTCPDASCLSAGVCEAAVSHALTPAAHHAWQGITVLLLLITSLGSTIFWALGASMVFVGAHAVTHKTEFHQVEATEFGAPPPADNV